MSIPSEKITINAEVDTSGLNCPLPILRAKKALANLTSGQVLKVIATDKNSIQDFQAFTKQTGHQIISQTSADNKIIHLLRRR